MKLSLYSERGYVSIKKRPRGPPRLQEPLLRGYSARARMSEPTKKKAVFDPTGEEELDPTLRPRSFAEFVGQKKVVENLQVYLRAAKERKEPPEHILLSGLPGLGKTTLAQIVAVELGAQLKSTTGPALERAKDLIGILTNLKKGDILFIDEIHRIPAAVEEYLYGAMEDFLIDFTIDQGPNARVLQMRLHRFTLIGATTREGLLSAPFRGRFGVLEKLQPYPPEELIRIVERAAKILGVALDSDGALRIASRSRGIPRIANRFLRRIRDLAQVKGAKRIDAALTEEGLRMLGVDERGLEDLDRRILATIVRLGGGPVGLKTVAVSVGEEEETIEEVYEPFLIREGYLEKTPRGRKATPLSYQLVGAKPDEAGLLF